MLCLLIYIQNLDNDVNLFIISFVFIKILYIKIELFAWISWKASLSNKKYTSSSIWRFKFFKNIFAKVFFLSILGILYFVNAICNSHPKLINIRYYAQELTLLFDFVKDFYFLMKHRSTYAENFYGLQRQNETGKTLSKLKILLQAAVVTVVPYILTKIQQFYNRIVQQEQNQGKILSKWQKLFTKLYPYFYMIISLVQTIWKFKYLLFQSSQYYDLYYRSTKSKLKYIESQEGEEEDQSYPLLNLLKTPGLLTLLMSHKIITWYFSQKNSKRKKQVDSHQQKKISPLRLQENQQNRQNEKTQRKFNKNQCPICGKAIVNPTIIKQSGFVYCYQCIAKYVRQNRKCPMSLIQIDEQSMQLIYG